MKHFSLTIGNCHTFLNLSGSSEVPGLCLKKEKEREKQKQHELKIPVEPINEHSPHTGCFFKIHGHLDRVNQQESFFGFLGFLPFFF